MIIKKKGFAKYNFVLHTVFIHNNKKTVHTNNNNDIHYENLAQISFKAGKNRNDRIDKLRIPP